MNKWFLFLLFAGISAWGTSQSIERIEPPNWWAGMNYSHIQLLIYGPEIATLTPQSNHEDFKITARHVLTNPNYLFMDVQLGEHITPGEYEISFLDPEGLEVLSYAYPIEQRRAQSADREGFNNQDVMYLLTPDRFANGDPGNDELEIYREKKNRDHPYGRHGGDIQGIMDHLDYIKEMGFTALWLNPILENDQPEQSYHGYATTDYYQVDQRYGTNEDYVQLSKVAKSKGIKMIMDIISNHCGSYHWWMEDPPSDDWVNYIQDTFVISNHRKYTLIDPYASKTDREHMVKGWFVPQMPDLNQKNPFMSTYLIQNTIWWIEYADLDGIRQDTYSYPFRQFMADWTCAIMAEYPNINIVGEEWVDDPALIAYWQAGKVNHDGYTSCLPCIMDFPMNMDLHRALREEEAWGTGLIKLYENLAQDFHYADPNNLLIFPDNHDMSRIFTQVNEDYGLYEMAMAYILTMRGIPQIFYGTEILMANPGTESHGVIRSDFPGGWSGDERNAFTGVGLSDQQKKAQAFIKSLLNWRKDQKTIHTGQLQHYAPRDNVYVFFRYDEEKIIMTILNKNKEPYDLKMDRFDDLIADHQSGKEVISGKEITWNEVLSLKPWSAMIVEMF